MGVLDGADGVDGHVQGAVRAVLETDREGQTRGQLAVHLGLGGAGANGADGQAVREELWGDGVEHLAGNRHSLVRQVDEELARQAQALVDIEAVVDVRVVDETLPPDRRARLLQVGAHDDEQVILVLLLHLQKAVAVLESHVGVVDRAGPNDHHQPVLSGICAVNDGNGLLTALEDRLLRPFRLRDLMLEQVWRGKRVVSADCEMRQALSEQHIANCKIENRDTEQARHTSRILKGLLVTHVGVLNEELRR